MRGPNVPRYVRKLALFEKPGRVEPVRSHLALASLAFALAACIQQPGTGADGGAEDATPTAIVDGGAAGPQAQGIDCITEPSTGVSICTGISICPKVLVDHEVYPNCGFRVRGTTLDLEC